MTRTETSPPPNAPAGPARRSWIQPRVQSFETRPEVTAYAGTDGPWNNR